MDIAQKLAILTDAAKYDAACTSSGVRRASRPGMIGNTTSSIAGCCHSFSADGRCITLLKVLMSNACCYDCAYCVNRRSNDTPRASFTPRELAELTIEFYRRNYIEGLFLSSGVLRSPDYTTEQMIAALRMLRQEYRFNGYIHAKAIPGTSPELVHQLGLLADRLSVNIELPSQQGLQTLAPDKSKEAILRPMGQIRDTAQENRRELVKYKHTPAFAPAGQSTQLIVGATADSDRHILGVTVWKVPAQACVLLCLHSGSGKRPSSLLGYKATAAAGTSLISGRLAAAVLRLSGSGTAGREASRLQPLPGSKSTLGTGSFGTVPCGYSLCRYRNTAARSRYRTGQRAAHCLGTPQYLYTV